MMSADVSSEETGESWESAFGNLVEEIINRKRSSTQGRELALARFCNVLMRHYVYDAIRSKTNELIPALLKSVKSESEQEAGMALRGKNS